MYLYLNYRHFDITSVALINYVCCPYKQNAELNLSFFFNVFTENLYPQYLPPAILFLFTKSECRSIFLD